MTAPKSRKNAFNPPARKATMSEEVDLFNAINKNDLSKAEAILKKYPDAVMWRDPIWHDVTPLIHAVENSHYDMAVLMIDHGAALNAQDNRGSTALMRATYNNESSFVALLLERGARLGDKDFNGRTARDIAEKYEYDRVIRAIQEHLDKQAAAKEAEKERRKEEELVEELKVFKEGLPHPILIKPPLKFKRD